MGWRMTVFALMRTPMPCQWQLNARAILGPNFKHMLYSVICNIAMIC